MIIRQIRAGIAMLFGALSLPLLAHPFAPQLLFSYISHPQISLIQDELRQAYSNLGIELAFTPVASEREFILGNRGDVDGIAAKFAFAEEQLPDMVRVDVPLMTVEIYLVCSQSVVCQHQVLQDARKTIALVGGKTVLSEVLGDSPVRRIELSSHQQVLDMLGHKRIDYALLALSYKHIPMLGSQGIQIALPAVYKGKVYHYLHQRYAEQVADVERELRYVVERSNSISK
ncbi:hypothetical protein KJY73_21050 [Bowmanella sp. Y26]|uniref:hypothetical protein n=1 Tax=Bowmanella yangjiangensis TaxID=2811230 RepID=UPI001BDBCC8B|nr:hypothetical protein [Bowmanella yangjiangensis]MBT1066076.1 hypothetical protein [Bowmanella yangjiangensis]